MSATLRRPPSPPPGWRSIRPWNRLTLHVREITPVSATFILSSSLALRVWDDSEDTEDSDHAGPSQPPKLPLKPLSMSELLRKGLAVKLNNAPWPKVVMHIDDDADMEAIVILYGLLPSRQYDIELALVASEESIRGKIVTESGSDADDNAAAAAIVVDEEFEEETPSVPASAAAQTLPTVVVSGQTITPAATRPPTPTSDAPPLAPALIPLPPPPRPPMTVEERATQLLHELTALEAEKESLNTRLKNARRESQRADAALRSEIEALKRAAEKSAQNDMRSRQKILALQEATKQLLAASVEADQQVKLVEASLPQLEARSKAAEMEYKQVIEESAREHTLASESIKKDRRIMSDIETEYMNWASRLEKLNARKDKLVTETVPELEAQLVNLGQEIEEAEKAAMAGMHTPPTSVEDLGYLHQMSGHPLLPASL